MFCIFGSSQLNETIDGVQYELVVPCHGASALVNVDNIQAVSSPDSDSGRSNLPIGRVKPQRFAQNAYLATFWLGVLLVFGTSFLIFVVSIFGGYIDGFGQNGKRRIRD